MHLAAAFAIALILAAPATGASAAPPRVAGASAPDSVPPIGPNLGLSDGRLRAATVAHLHGAPAPDGVTADGDRVLVEVLHAGGRDRALAAVADAGGEVTGEAGTSLIEAWVPFDQLLALEHRPGIGSVRIPLAANEPLSMDPAAPDGLASLDATGQEIAKTKPRGRAQDGSPGRGLYSRRSRSPSAAAVSYDGKTHRATLNATSKLAAKHTYRVLLSSSIRDKAGNALKATGWSFKTGS